MPESAVPAYITSLIRHFEDLRDGTHGGSASRKGELLKHGWQSLTCISSPGCEWDKFAGMDSDFPNQQGCYLGNCRETALTSCPSEKMLSLGQSGAR
jgi:hypothetical protein